MVGLGTRHLPVQLHFSVQLFNKFDEFNERSTVVTLFIFNDLHQILLKMMAAHCSQAFKTSGHVL
jgi:hypothetical protein